MTSWRREAGDWTRYRHLPRSVEVDFHRADRGEGGCYWQQMEAVEDDAYQALVAAYEIGLEYVIFTHGHSTSRRGRKTSRSMVRGLMRSPAATPFIRRRESIEHISCFVAAIRENPGAPVLPDTPPCPTCGSSDARAMTQAGEFRCKECRWRFTWFSLAGNDPGGWQDG